MSQPSLDEYRCACGRLLFRGGPLFSVVEVKCKRCGVTKAFACESSLDHDSVPSAEAREKLLLHLETGDYFAVLGTLLGCVAEDESIANSAGAYDQSVLAAIKAAREDLAFLHEHYRIVPK